MRKLLRWFMWGGAAALGIVLILVTGLFVVQPQRYKDFIEQQIVAAAQRAKVGLRIGGSELTPLQFRAHHVQLAIPRSFLFFDIDTIEVRPRYSSLFSGAPRADVKAALYKGTLDAELRYEPSRQQGDAAITMQQVAISEHPQLAGFGFRDGVMDLTIGGARFDAAGLTQGDFLLTLEGVQKPGASKFPLKSFGLPFNVEIPAVADLAGRLEGSLQKQDIAVKTFTLTSSLGDARFTGKATLTASGRIQDWSLDGSVELSSEGSQSFGQYLPLLSNEVLDPSARRFRVAARSGFGLPEVKFSRM